jgi:hypothetical protein
MKRETVKIIYRKTRRDNGEVIALFPGITATRDPETCQCYAHLGQHGSAHYAAVVNESRPATPEEYAPLHKELSRIYSDCNIVILQRAGNNAYNKRNTYIAVKYYGAKMRDYRK